MAYKMTPCSLAHFMRNTSVYLVTLILNKDTIDCTVRITVRKK